MRKILSLLMMALFSVSMFAADPAAAGTTLFSEDFSSYAKDAVLSGAVTTGTGRVVYGDASVTYASKDNGSNITKIYEEALAGGKSPELLVGKNGGEFSITGIPSGGAKEITVAFKQNAQKLTVALTGEGYSTTYASPKPQAAGEVSFAVTVAENADATFGIVMSTGSSNVRVDDILVTVKTAGEGGGDPEPTHTYTVAGSSDVAFGTTWAPANTANDMVKQDNGTYKWEKTNLTLPAGAIEFKVCEDHDWKVSYPAQNYSLNIAEAGIYTITITFDPAAESDKVAAQASKTGEAVVVPSVAMHGNFTGDKWADTENFALADNKESASLKLTLAAGNYEFGMRIGGSGNWTSNGVSFTRENASAVVEAGEGNLKLAADEAGDYTFTWTFADNKLTITFPEQSIEVELQEVSDAISWDFSKITANTANALYNKEGIQLTDESTPNKNEEVVYANYSADFMTFAEGFDATTMAFKGEYPIRKNKYCQNGTLRFKTTVAGSIVVKFSDTGSSASATAVKRYLVVNGEQTEYWTSRENNGTENPYDAQLDVTTGAIAVAAGEVTITGSSAIVVYSVEFAPASAPEPVLANGYYLIGQKGWDVAALSADLLFAANPEKEGEFQLSVTLVKDQSIKVVEVENDAIKTWFPDGMGNDYKVDEAHAGNVTIYFRPDKQGGEGWHEGYIYIAPNQGTGVANTAVDAKAVKVINNGQLFIIRNGKTYNVQGQVVK